MFERHQKGERAVLVTTRFQQSFSAHLESLREFRDLARAAGAEVLAVVTGHRDRPDPRLFVGSGKLAEIADEVIRQRADLVLFNHDLGPAQERNLERHLSCRVLDRTGLILDIFAQRARSFEGKLQVELAQLKHLSTRLVRGWTHLERQKGGIGLRGPGEAQLETDRRLLALRIRQINKRLEQVRKQRLQGRQSRRKAQIPTVALVGYTNTGKSTLFNHLTGESIYAADQLFATLDPTLRRLDLPSGQSLILVDTVGFVSDLPHELIQAFHATLLETCDADLLLHVIDVSRDHHASQTESVHAVLAAVGAGHVPRLEVFNKIDQTSLPSGVGLDDTGQVDRVNVSALSGEGIPLLRQQLQRRLQRERVMGWLHTQADMGALRASLYAEKAVLTERAQSDGSSLLRIDMDRCRWRQLSKRHAINAQSLAETPGSGVS